MKILLCVIHAALCEMACAQMTWVNVAAPITSSACYDSARDRLVVPSWPLTYEFDGSVWSAIQASGGAYIMAYDRARGRTVGIYPGGTEEWNGTSWSLVPTSPPMVGYYSGGQWPLMTFHSGRGRIVALSPTYSPFTRLELYDWDGTTWTHIPSYSPLPIPNPLPGASDYLYGGFTYDAVRDRLVVCGRRYMAGSHVIWSAETWEWDSINGWVAFGSSGPTDESHLWFDEHRGVVLRATNTTPTSTVLRWDSSQGWLPVGTLSNAPAYYNGGAYDSRRNRYYYGTAATSLAAITDLNPAQYSFHGGPCAAPSPPTLTLSQPWTRAWLGNTLQVAVANLPLSIGFLGMGFSDQQYGTTPLPLHLAAYGMPGCVLHVAPDASELLVGTNNMATKQIPIPNDLALLGVTFWQQALGVAPGVNPAGLLTSASMRGTLGKAY